MKKVLALIMALTCCISMYADEYYLVGGCTESGWNAGEWQRSAVRAYSADGTTWAAAVKLTVGEGDNGRFKIPNGANEWGGFWAPSQGTVLTSDWSDLSTDSNGDNKFCVAEEGMYLVSFNISTKKIKADKLTEPSKDGDFYLISSVNDYYWFAAYIATDETNTSKARLTADLSFQGKTFTPMASDKHKFKGEFDGGTHTIDYAIVNSNYSSIGLFCYADVAYIHDLVIGTNSSFKGVAKIGGIIGFARDRNGDVTLKNVINRARVEATGNTDANAAGLVGCATDGKKILATNCANTGEVHGQDGQCAAFAGWTQSGTTFTNCWNIGDIYNMDGNRSLYRNDGAVSATNCYDANGADFYIQGNKIARSTVASGELCYKLNGDQSAIAWYQTIGTDEIPVPFSVGGHSQVYANAHFDCGGTPMGTVVYANVNEEQHDSHIIDNGFCTVCKAMVEYVADYMTPATDGYYEISDNKQMRWFAAMIKDYRNVHNLTANADCNAPVNARLMNDIDFTGVKDFAPIGGLWGQGNTRYAGTFDGQGYKIKNLVADLDKNEVGVFGVISEGAVIKNFTLDNSCSLTGNAHVGIVGEIWHSQDGEVRLECLGNEASITGRGNNVGGILGVNMLNGSYAKLYMTNCYSTGAIKGNSENGQLTGWSGDGAVVENCYAIGETTNCDGFGRFPNGCTLTNNFCDKDLNWGPTKITDNMLASGELAYKLGAAFSQLIGTDTHPVFGNAPVSYVGEAGYATLYDATTGYELNGDVKAYAAVLNNTWLDLSEIGVEVPAGNAVVLKGTYYNKLAADLPAINIANDLKGTTAATEADGTMYVLAKVDGKVGFYKATGTIAAGKAYYQSASGVKAFYFDGDDATGISGVDANLNANDAIYNIAGQRIQKMQKGINIINGKKVLF